MNTQEGNDGWGRALPNFGRTILLAGPTAGGKSALSLRLAAELATDDTPVWIINSDSMQVYADLDIISARPLAADLAQVPHKLYGYVDGARAHNVADWVEDAFIQCREIWAEGGIAIIVGGTGMYFKALTVGLAEVPEIDPDIRAAVRAHLHADGAPAVHQSLAALDPDMAQRLHANDSQRLARALEVVKSTGKSLLHFQQNTQPGPLAASEQAGCVQHLVVDLPRDVLYGRCDLRFQLMLEQGGLSEIEALAARDLDPSLPVMRALGVPPLLAHLAGEIDYDAAVAQSQQETRRFAKRQLTWFRNQFAHWQRIPPDYSLS